MALKPRRSVKKRMGCWDQIKTFDVQVSKHSTKASIQSQHAQQHQNLLGVEARDASQKKEKKENCPSHTLPNKNLNLLIYCMTERHGTPAAPGRMLLCCRDYAPLLLQQALMNPSGTLPMTNWCNATSMYSIPFYCAESHLTMTWEIFLDYPKKRTSERDFLSIGSQGTYA